jgi:hypothetical protein
MRILIFLIFGSLACKSQYYMQYFEGNTNNLTITFVPVSGNLWTIGKPNKTLFNKAATTPNAIFTDTTGTIPKNNVSTFTFSYSNDYFGSPFPEAVRWKQKLDMRKKGSAGIIEYSHDSGKTWFNPFNLSRFYGFQPTNKDTLAGNIFCFSGRDTTWRDIWLCFHNKTPNNDTTIIRFTYKSDTVASTEEGWMMDNFTIQRTIFHPVNEYSNSKAMTVYPTKTSGIVNVELKNPEKKMSDLNLLDMNGKLLQKYGPNSSKVVLDISEYPPGIYYVEIRSDKKQEFFKVFRENY